MPNIYQNYADSAISLHLALALEELQNLENKYKKTIVPNRELNFLHLGISIIKLVHQKIFPILSKGNIVGYIDGAIISKNIFSLMRSEDFVRINEECNFNAKIIEYLPEIIEKAKLANITNLNSYIIDFINQEKNLAKIIKKNKNAYEELVTNIKLLQFGDWQNKPRRELCRYIHHEFLLNYITPTHDLAYELIDILSNLINNLPPDLKECLPFLNPDALSKISSILKPFGARIEYKKGTDFCYKIDIPDFNDDNFDLLNNFPYFIRILREDFWKATIITAQQRYNKKSAHEENVAANPIAIPMPDPNPIVNPIPNPNPNIEVVQEEVIQEVPILPVRPLKINFFTREINSKNLLLQENLAETRQNQQLIIELQAELSHLNLKFRKFINHLTQKKIDLANIEIMIKDKLPAALEEMSKLEEYKEEYLNKITLLETRINDLNNKNIELEQAAKNISADIENIKTFQNKLDSTLQAKNTNSTDFTNYINASIEQFERKNQAKYKELANLLKNKHYSQAIVFIEKSRPKFDKNKLNHTVDQLLINLIEFEFSKIPVINDYDLLILIVDQTLIKQKKLMEVYKCVKRLELYLQDHKDEANQHKIQELIQQLKQDLYQYTLAKNSEDEKHMCSKMQARLNIGKSFIPAKEGWLTLLLNLTLCVLKLGNLSELKTIKQQFFNKRQERELYIQIEISNEKMTANP